MNMEHSEILQLREGTLVRYYQNGWRIAYFERPEPPKRPKVAVLIPTMLGKRRIRVKLANVEVIQS
jgi:hypothetical protein